MTPLDLFILRDAACIGALVSAAIWFFWDSISDRIRTAWRNLQTRFLPDGKSDNDRLMREYRGGRL